MKIINRLTASLLVTCLGGVLLAGCAQTEQAAPENVPVTVMYPAGVAALQNGNYAGAIEAFQNVTQMHPYSLWAPRALLLQGYAQYKANKFNAAITSFSRYISLYPAAQNIAYAYYMQALCYYDRIGRPNRSEAAAAAAVQALQQVIDLFPTSVYARDSRLKLTLAKDRLAAHDMEVGRFYEQQHEYEGAISRYQDVINNYPETNQVPEALERLIEVYLRLGLIGQAQRTLVILGYNYPGNYWYEIAYREMKRVNLLPPQGKNSFPAS